MMDLPNKTLLRPDEVASFLQVSERTICRWVECGKLDGKNIGERLIRIPREAVLRFIDNPK